MPCMDCATTVEARDSDIGCATCAPPALVCCPGCRGELRGGLPCPNCVCCTRCEVAVPRRNTIETVRGSLICRQCQLGRYWQCPACDGWNQVGRACANDCCTRGCDDCRDDVPDDLVHNYTYRPSPRFHGTGPLFLGPEIEIETPYGRNQEFAALACSYLGALGYLKSDSSLVNGFEIVTHPMSYPWAMANFPWQMLRELDAAGCSTTPNTGIHVHLSRAGFSSACHIYRWMKFIYRNQDNVTVVARRSSHEWAPFTGYDRRAIKDYVKGAHGDRYRAINTNNANTLELRIFASSLDPD